MFWQRPLPAIVNGGQANVSGTVPWFYKAATGEFATYDPSGFAGTFNRLGDTASLLSRLGRLGLRQGQRPPQNPGPTPTGSDAALALADDDPATDAVDAVFSRFSSSYAAAYLVARMALEDKFLPQPSLAPQINLRHRRFRRQACKSNENKEKLRFSCHNFVTQIIMPDLQNYKSKNGLHPQIMNHLFRVRIDTHGHFGR